VRIRPDARVMRTADDKIEKGTQIRENKKDEAAN
jgi:hypothetical protein